MMSVAIDRPRIFRNCTSSGRAEAELPKAARAHADERSPKW